MLVKNLNLGKLINLITFLGLLTALALTSACAGSPIRSSASSVLGSGNQALFLTVTQPQDNSTTTSSRIEVKGKTTRDAVVTINEQITNVDSSGNFSIFINLDPGPNSIEVVASDQEGNSMEKTLVVTLKAGG
jgi:hypothetical protein